MEIHRLSRARARANTSVPGRDDISPHRYASYRRAASSSQSCSTSASRSSSKGSISVCPNSAFCFGLSLSSSTRSSETSQAIFVTPVDYRQIFQSNLRDCVAANDQAQPRTSRVAGCPSAGATGYASCRARNGKRSGLRMVSAPKSTSRSCQ